MEKYAQGDDVRITVIDTDAQVEDSATNSMGFYDSPRNYLINPEQVETLLSLRKYLSRREIETSTSIGAKSPKRWLESIKYLESLNHLYLLGRNFDLSTSKGIEIDDAVSRLERQNTTPLQLDQAA